MFSKHDPRATALLTVHEGRVTVSGLAYDGRPEFLIDNDPAWGVLNELFDDGYISYDEDAPLPASVGTTDKGQLALTALFSILPPAPAEQPDPLDDGSDESQEAEAQDEGIDPHDLPPAARSGGVCVEYFGFGPAIIDFVNDEKFRAIVRKHGFQIRLQDDTTLDAEVPLTEPTRLWLRDPVSGGWLAVLYDDTDDSWLESPGFIEILQLMDDYSKERFQSRLFVYSPLDEDDEDDDELEMEVDQDHLCYDREYDFTTGRYKEA